MSKKPRKIEEAATHYAAKKPAKAEPALSKGTGTRCADDAAFKKISDKIFSERKELLHKLAQ